MTTYKILGVTDERTECECCGRAGLKRTIALETDGRVVYYGTDCARRSLGISAWIAAKATEVHTVAVALAAVCATLKSRPDAKDLRVRSARGAAFDCREALLSLDWDAPRATTERAIRDAYATLRFASAV